MGQSAKITESQSLKIQPRILETQEALEKLIFNESDQAKLQDQVPNNDADQLELSNNPDLNSGPEVARAENTGKAPEVLENGQQVQLGIENREISGTNDPETYVTDDSKAIEIAKNQELVESETWLEESTNGNSAQKNKASPAPANTSAKTPTKNPQTPKPVAKRQAPNSKANNNSFNDFYEDSAPDANNKREITKTQVNRSAREKKNRNSKILFLLGLFLIIVALSLMAIKRRRNIGE